MAANSGPLQTITDMMTKLLKKVSKIERNIYKMANKSINGCKSGVTTYEYCSQSLIPCKLTKFDSVVTEAIEWVKSQPLK